MKRIFLFLTKLLPQQKVYAHCDIPCGIYDPHQAQVAAHTIIRMTQLITELKKNDETKPGSAEVSGEAKKVFIHTLARYTKVKEEHAEIVKHEVTVLWGDYFKEENLKEYPRLHELVFKTLKLASKTKQEVSMSAAKELLMAVQEIAEIFYKTKNVATAKIPAWYPTGETLLVPKA